MMNRRFAHIFCIAAVGALAAAGAHAQNPQTPLTGRWDLTVAGPNGPYPSWLEVKLSGRATHVGSFVAQGGSARPISEILFKNGEFSFEIPVQWESGSEKVRVDGKLQSDRLSGTLKDAQGKTWSWTGVRAPALRRTKEPKWGTPVELFNGRNLDGWAPRHPSAPNGWVVENGLLKNARPGNDLVTTQKFDDFKVHLEFRYPKGSNSGVYLRGRYEAQVEDDYGQEPESHLIGGIYGFLTPRINAAKPAGEWQTYDVKLVGRYVTVVLNGEEVITRQEIPGITGGALDSREGEPGPLMLQGDHGQIEFRKITLTPGR